MRWSLAILLSLLLGGAVQTGHAATDGGDITGLGEVRGRVTSPDGRPLAGADVRLTRLDPELGALSYTRMRSTFSEPDGTFRFRGLEFGAFLLDARHEHMWLPIPVRIVVGNGAERAIAGVSLCLETAATITGKVLDEHGNPLPGVGVSVGDNGMQNPTLDRVTVLDYGTGRLTRLKSGATYPRLPIATTQTDGDGSFVLTPVVPADDTSIRVGGLVTHLDQTIAGISTSAAKATHVTVELRRGATIRGRVLDGNGRGLAGARVTLRVVEYEPVDSAWVVLTNRRRMPTLVGDSTSLFSGDDGAFQFDGLTMGKYVVIAEARGFARSTSGLVMLTQPDEKVAEDVKLVPERTLRGVVLAPDGSGHRGGGCVRVVRDGGVSDALTPYVDDLAFPVQGNGSFFVEGLGPGDVELYVDCEPYARVHVERVRPDEREIEVRLLSRLPVQPLAPTVSPQEPPAPPARKRP